MHQNSRNLTDTQKLKSNADNDAGQWELKKFSEDHNEELS